MLYIVYHNDKIVQSVHRKNAYATDAYVHQHRCLYIVAIIAQKLPEAKHFIKQLKTNIISFSGITVLSLAYSLLFSLTIFYSQFKRNMKKK